MNLCYVSQPRDHALRVPFVLPSVPPTDATPAPTPAPTAPGKVGGVGSVALAMMRLVSFSVRCRSPNGTLLLVFCGIDTPCVGVTTLQVVAWIYT